ncbi:TonB-dependent siderophore receptor [Xanthomonas campestris]|uniref:TonB-dependent siderophore receptor n=1 Tax=Xanthomonas campestris TaxID=339 RepID=UPI002B232AED|nr:TonB-dependent siderophore receptor [Xanthomonas campestris]MEA9756170.1 TonB-dependent siderophore receptor [Xanthomonas campestris pv. raphani]MEA9764338.1 TonB-dependent siderophore receptor [Xanthomonas campestris pv. raphani]MEA9816908.1 TonB-dependent siderophore receptor [Xanthomonas campestris pv. raphani]MEA9910090.1 TonB-dependent siderophore receptor [Xanthomonas campestris pv. raphani]MEA9926409.1 TonB-dependent siderophore receptor [Xanthomonas campestris pv. raphani]
MPAKTLPLATLSAALLCALTMTPAAARAADLADANADANAKTLDAVSVNGTVSRAQPATTTRLPLTLQETPQSVSVIGLQRLEDESLFSIDDVMRNVTGVNVSFYDTQRPLYFARGFQITDFQVDGLPTYSGATNQEYDTVFYDRIEVIRGANGLLTGAGIPSATVNLLRKRPGKEFDASFAVSAGTWDFRRMQADVNAPLTSDGRWRSRVVAAWQDRDYYYDRYHDTKMSGMAVLEGDLTESTTLTVGYQRQDNTPVGSTWGTVPFFAADGTLANLSRSTNLAPEWTRWQRETSTAFANLEQRIGEDWLLRVNAAHTKGNVQSLRVYGTGYPAADGSGLFLRTGVGETEDTRDSVDVYLSGGFSLFGRQHDVVVGGSWQDLQSTSYGLAQTYPDDWATCPNAFGPPERCYFIPNIRNWDGNASEVTYARNGRRSEGRTTQRGVYGSTRFRLADPLSLIAGARLSSWETRTQAFDASGAYTGTSGRYEVSDEVTPYVGLVYDIVPDVSVYASYTEIFNPQNYRDKDNNLLAPVEGSNLEAGIKAQLLDGHAMATAAVFEAKQDNFAVRDMTQPESSLPDGNSAYIGVNGTKSRGWEMDFNGEVLPGWTVNAGYTHVKVTRAPTDAIYANLPEDYLQLSTQVRLPGAWDRLSIGGGVSWQSAVRGFNIARPTGDGSGATTPVTVVQNPYALVHFNANYRISEQWTATLAVRNAFDKTYWANLDYQNYGEPRFVSVSLRWRY